jgi:hypothetical protein
MSADTTRAVAKKKFHRPEHGLLFLDALLDRGSEDHSADDSRPWAPTAAGEALI